MNAQDFVNKIGFWTGTAGAVFVFFQKLSPANIGEEHIDVTISFLRGASYEVIFVVILALYAWQYQAINSFVSQCLRFDKKWYLTSFVGMLLACILNARPLARLAKYRYLTYQIHNSFYRYDLYTAICEEVNAKRFDKALNVCDTYEKIYGQDDQISDMKEQLANRIKYGALYYSLNQSAKPDSLNEKSEGDWDRMLISYVYWPNPALGQRIRTFNDRLKNLLDLAGKFYDLCESNKAPEVFSLYRQLNVFLFEDDLRSSIDKSQTPFFIIKSYLQMQSRTQFIERLASRWMITSSDDLLNWSISMRVEKDLYQPPEKHSPATETDNTENEDSTDSK